MYILEMENDYGQELFVFKSVEAAKEWAKHQYKANYDINELPFDEYWEDYCYCKKVQVV